jgi:hypothetical protein
VSPREVSKITKFEKPDGLDHTRRIDDGECFPAEIQAMQGERLHEFANPFMQPNSPKQELLADVMSKRFCASIERTLQATVPPYHPKWEHVAHKQFEGVFRIHTQSQKTVPSLVLPIK